MIFIFEMFTRTAIMRRIKIIVPTNDFAEETQRIAPCCLFVESDGEDSDGKGHSLVLEIGFQNSPFVASTHRCQFFFSRDMTPPKSALYTASAGQIDRDIDGRP